MQMKRVLYFVLNSGNYMYLYAAEKKILEKDSLRQTSLSLTRAEDFAG